MTNHEKDALPKIVRIRPRLDVALVRDARSMGINLDQAATRGIKLAIASAKAASLLRAG
jgi:post-segregation antitoxin (ccd killing protein)